MRQNYCIYKLTSPSGKVYIGITSYGDNPNERWKNGNGYKNCTLIERAIEKYGWKHFSHEVIESGLSKEAAMLLEQTLIKSYQSNNPLFGYNLSSGGENGARHSDETKKKIAEWHRGTTLSEETRQKISNKAKGRTLSAESRLKLSKATKGRAQSLDAYLHAIAARGKPTFSEEGKQRLSEAARINRNRRKRVICNETGMIFESARDASAYLGKNKCAIAASIYSGTKCGGYTWKYLDDDGGFTMSISEENIRANLIMPKELKERIMELARSENRSFSNYVVTLLQKHVDSLSEP